MLFLLNLEIYHASGLSFGVSCEGLSEGPWGGTYSENRGDTVDEKSFVISGAFRNENMKIGAMNERTILKISHKTAVSFGLNIKNK